MNSISALLSQFRQLKLKLALEGMLIGFMSGLVVVFYRLILEKAEQLRVSFMSTIHSGWQVLIGFLVLILIALLVGQLMIKDPMICGSGIPQVEGILANKLKMNPLSVLIRKFIGGTLCLGAGLSVGREGPSIQLGAAMAQYVSQLTKRSKLEEKYLLSSGASAGLSAAFNAPLAGVLFSLEEVHKHFSPLVLISAMSASLTADFISKNFFGLKPVFNFNTINAIPLNHYWLIVILGIITGLCGVFYNKTIKTTLESYDQLTGLKKQYRPIIPFLLAGILGFVLPQILGDGHSLIESLIHENFTIQMLLLLLIAKFLFSMISFGSGVPGGIFFPILVLGALTGSIFGNAALQLQLIDETFIQHFIILAMAGYFTAIVRAPITGSILITEMTGSLTHLLSLSLISLIAYTVAEGFKSEPVYDYLLARQLQSTEPLISSSEQKTILEVPIFTDSKIDGHYIHELNLPNQCLLIAIKRGSHEIIPRGNTKLFAGDYLIVLLEESIAASVQEELNLYCHTLNQKV